MSDSKSNLLRRGTDREKAWKYIRMTNGKPFTITDLLRKIPGSTVDNFRRYLRALYQHDVLIRLPIRLANGKWQYRLNKDIGLLPPVLVKIGAIYDPNSKKVLTPNEEIIIEAAKKVINDQ